MKLKTIFFILLAPFIFTGINAQELYPYSEPASNMPAQSISLKMGTMLHKTVHSNELKQRHMPEIMFGINKEWMVHAGINFSDMHQDKMKFEALRFYTKYRFLSLDELHKHFRMAAFAAGNYSKNHLDHNEINMMGDQSAIQVGLIATQLWHKLAISGTGSLVEVVDEERWSKQNQGNYAFRAFNYSLSAGYLLFPKDYTDYNQTNVNLYAELIGSRNINFPMEKYFVDLAPSIQFIFKSTAKLNFGYRFQLSSDIYRIADRSYLISYEHIFLNALKRRRRTTTETAL
ncbi:MAG: hypothetical protein ACR2KB_13790 [Chitinophagaceae bacterium]